MGDSGAIRDSTLIRSQQRLAAHCSQPDRGRERGMERQREGGEKERERDMERGRGHQQMRGREG